MLGWYYAKRFLVSFVRVFLVVAALVYVGEFLDHIRDFGSDSGGLRRAATAAALRAPTFLSQALPVIALLAGIAFSVGLARFSEFVISRAAGLSALRSLFPTFLTAFLLGLATILLFDPFAGQMLEKHSRYTAPPDLAVQDTVAIDAQGYWVRQTSEDGHLILWASSAENNGQVLRDVTAISFDAEGRAQNRIYSNIALLDDNHWIFARGKQWSLDPAISNPELSARGFGIERIPTNITPRQILEGFPDPTSIPVWHIPELASDIAESGFSNLKYRMYFQSELARPLLFIAMVAIGVMFTLQNARLGNLGTAILTALICGFGLHFLQSFAKTLGDAAEVAVPIAAWFPPLAACLLALAVFLHLEDG